MNSCIQSAIFTLEHLYKNVLENSTRFFFRMAKLFLTIFYTCNKKNILCHRFFYDLYNQSTRNVL